MKPSLLARLRARLRPPRELSITRAGRTYLIITIGVGLGALNTGNNLLYLVLGLLLSMIVVSGVLSERCLRHVRVRRLLPQGVFAHETFALRYAVSKRRSDAFSLTLAEHRAALQVAAVLPYVPAGEERNARADVVAPRRGPLALTGVRVTTTFPFGLFAKTRVFEVADVLLVYPRRGFVCSELPPDASDQVGEGGDARRRDGGGDLWGLRELSPMEDARRVHWLKSAAAGKLLRTERDRDERRQVRLEVEVGQPLEALDARCEEAAARAHHHLSRGDEVGLRAGARALRPSSSVGQERRILAMLALVGYEDGERGEAAS